MYKAAVIEDEYYIRQSIIMKLKNSGFEVSYDTDDGEELLLYLKENTIDLLVADISMPLMNGLELIDKINKAGYDIVYCILTGFSSFEYMREAMRLGVTDYLLKPIDADEFNITAEKIKEQLTIKAEEKAKKNQYILKEYLTGGDLISEGFNDLKFDAYSVRLTLLGNWNGNQKWFSYNNRSAVNTVYPGKPNLLVEILDKKKEITRVSETQTVYNSGIYNDILKLSQIINDAKKLIKQNLILDELRIIGNTNEITYNIANISRSLDAIEKFAEKKDFSKIIEQAEIIFNYHNVPQSEYELIFKKIILILYKYISFSERLIDYDWIFQSDTKEQFKKEAVENLKFILYPVDVNETAASCKESVEKIIIEVKSSYSSNFSLQSMAEKHFVNRSHLARVFKQVTGKTFNEYVTDVKIKRACELISEGHNITQASYLVGFEDTRYFSQVFKKNMGMPPSSYISEKK